MRPPHSAPLPSRAGPAVPTALAGAIEAHGYVLLYDGVCGLCNRVVRWILRFDRGGPMRFATLEGDLGNEARRLIPELDGVDSLVLLSRAGAQVRSTAALEVARYLGGPWSLALLAYAVPRPWRDRLYDWVARRRYRVFGRLEACPLPAPEVRERFLD